MSIDTMRTSIALAVLCPASSSSSSRKQTSSSAADSVAEPLDVQPFVIELHTRLSAQPFHRLRISGTGTGTGTFTGQQEFRDTP